MWSDGTSFTTYDDFGDGEPNDNVRGEDCVHYRFEVASAFCPDPKHRRESRKGENFCSYPPFPKLAGIWERENWSASC